MLNNLLKLCEVEGCRLLHNHEGPHNKYTSSPWNFMEAKDKNKIAKAGFATPRGGNKGAYQNHVVRNNRVIIPFEKLGIANLDHFHDRYVIRLFPEQYFESKRKPKKPFLQKNTEVIVGKNAFVLYRTHKSYNDLPPLKGWKVCHLQKDGKTVYKRGKDVKDIGHYVLRVSSLGPVKGIEKGPPQGLFAPEYADEGTNYLCKIILAWLIVHAKGSPYTTTQASHIRSILDRGDLLKDEHYEFRGILRHGLTCCPLCMKILSYNEFHDVVDFEDADSLENAGIQLEGSTRSTIVNLFHLEPLLYSESEHIPANVAWGHALCNTRLGQRKCYSLEELKEMDLKIGIVREDGIETFGWFSKDMQFIRGPKGSVWIQISQDSRDID